MGKIFSGGGSSEWPGFELREIHTLRKLVQGNTGADVIYLEKCLKALDWIQREPLGKFDAVIYNAVRSFQTFHKLDIDGKVGTVQTWPKLHALIEAKKNPPVSNPPKPTTGSSSSPVNPAYENAKKYVGKTEFDPEFQKKIVPYWKKVGLSGFKMIVGSAFAWCALFVVMNKTDVGQDYVASALARMQGKTDYAYDFRQLGIIEGAVYHTNHGGKCSTEEIRTGKCTAQRRWDLNQAACKSASSNHTGFTAGACAAADVFETFKDRDGVYRIVAKQGAVFRSLSGNSANSVRYTYEDANELCAVRVHRADIKDAVPKSTVNCIGASSGGSTR